MNQKKAVHSLHLSEKIRYIDLMASTTSIATEKAARILRFKKRSSSRQNSMLEQYVTNPLSKKYLRLRKKLASFPEKIRSRKISYQTVAGRNCGVLRTEGSRRIFIFLHGGAYIIGPSSYSWLFVEKISRINGITTLLPDYPKAPEWQYRQTLDYMVLFYRQILKDYPDHEILLGGSSAGGGLVLSTFLELKKDGLPLPKRLILISPWVDLTMKNPHLQEQENRDISLSSSTLSRAAEIYAGGEDLSQPLISPLFGDLSGLPPVLLLTGSEELFLSDCHRLRDRIKSQKSPLIYQEEPGLFHSWPVIPHLPESAEFQQTLTRFFDGSF